MFREIRRRDRAVSEVDAREILARAEYGVLATVGEDGWPYAVPVNHVVAGDVIYVHCASDGHKLENLGHEGRVSYCAVAGAQVMPQELSTLYESAVVFGRAAVVTDASEKQRALELLGQRFSAEFPREVADAIRKDGPRTAVVRIRIERITGKARR
jgi:nitroimidazol reductase NimA-like FMN-containing flavoprotein (pyridoxamine 5'-phosphate oxidase superfamily)